MAKQPRIGVYICHCGINIANTVDVFDVRAYAEELPGVVVAKDYTYMCSDPGQNLIVDDIGRYNLDKVVVSACSPRMHEPTFRSAIEAAGLNPYCLEIANIREQCSWVHPDIQIGTPKAKTLVASAVAKAALLEPLEEREVGVESSALVVGGGIAGLQAALDIARAGFPVFLVEKEEQLGGRVADLYRTYPFREPAAGLVQQLVEQLEAIPHATIMRSSTIKDVSGYVGNFVAQITKADGLETEIHIGAIIVATGFKPFDAQLKPELGYGS
ncbi:MAG: FAD-dependent oxidoreductase, partial [Chloroflexota bacterium]